MTPPVTFIALDHANVDAVREVLRGLPREASTCAAGSYC